MVAALQVPAFIRSQNLSDLQILDTLLKNYDRRATPTHQYNTSTDVSYEIYLRSFGSINPSTMDYQVDLYLRQSWIDPRLDHPNITRALDLSDPNIVKAIWKPEIFFPNAKQGEFQYVTVPNVLIRINPNGEILYMLRLKLAFSCMMDLSKYPLDSQVCTMEIASFAKTVHDLKLHWKEPRPVEMYSGLKMPQFEIRSIRHMNCQNSYHMEYSCIMAEFDLQRSIGFHLVQSYLPTILVVVISWVSFWMDVEAVPGRVTLGITTLLTVSSKASGVQSNLPQVSYVKAMDVWMGTCTAFVFAALLEFTHVNYLWRKTTTNTKQSEGANKGETWLPLNLTSDKTKSPDGDVGNGQVKCVNSYLQANKLTARRIDEMSRMAFPVSFFIFNLCYWCYYLS